MTRVEAVIDTNKIISIALRDGIVRRAFLFKNLRVYTIDYTLQEISEHKGIICRRFRQNLFDKLLEELVLPKTTIISIDELSGYRSKARSIAENFDIDDWPFIALALKLKLPIWTNDKEMIRYSIGTCKYLAIDTDILLRTLRDKLNINDWNKIKEKLKRKYSTAKNHSR